MSDFISSFKGLCHQGSALNPADGLTSLFGQDCL